MADESAWPTAPNGAPDQRDGERRLPHAAPAGRLRPARGLALGLILTTPLWVLLVLAIRNLFAWLR